MLLTLDIGNTNVTMGAFQGESLKASWRMTTELRRTPDEYAVLVQNMLELKGLSTAAIDGVAICSVVPPLTGLFEELSKTYLENPPLVVGAGTKTGLRILYDSPRDVGADRVVDAVAALRLYGGPVIVVDFGTATVFDAVTRDGDYLGGAIVPGLHVAADAIFLSTSQLRRVDLVAPRTAIGRNTVHAMQSGLVLGHVDMVEGMVRRFKEELGQDSKVVATGGWANLIARETDIFHAVNMELTLIGLRIIYEMNPR